MGLEIVVARVEVQDKRDVHPDGRKVRDKAASNSSQPGRCAR